MANNVALGYVVIQAQDRADMSSNPSITPAMWRQYVSSSYKEATDLMVAAYGNDYFSATPYIFNINGQNFYNLPDGKTTTSIGSTVILPAFYKLLGLDLQYSGSPTGWITLQRFEFIERNKNNIPLTTANYGGQVDLKYRLTGSQIQFNNYLLSTQNARAWYIPEPTNLVFAPAVATTLGSPNLVLSDITGISVGMSLYATRSIPSGATVTAVNTLTSSVTMSANALSTNPILIVQFWRDDAILTGMLAGWEEYVIIDAAIKAGIKSESLLAELKQSKDEMRMRIEAMAEGRDAGQAHHTSDAMAINGNDDGWGGMGGGGWDY